ncbi:MAG: DsbA family protein [Pseudomonadota bacterium]
MMRSDPGVIRAYVDLKSPYAYLAIEPTRRLSRCCGVRIDWLPYTLDIPSYLGSARVDETGAVIEEDRSPHQWRRVRYAYMDVRRYANLRGLTIRGTVKIWNTRLFSTALLWARDQARSDALLDIVFPRFWRRDFDPEDPSAVVASLKEAGCTADGYLAWAATTGGDIHDAVRREAEEAGVFGVPWYAWNNEVFWGREALPLLSQRITGNLPDWAPDLGLAPDDGS